MMAACLRTGGSLADGLRRRRNESGNKVTEATDQAPEQKQLMDRVLFKLKPFLADLIDEDELDARLIERLSGP